MKPATRKDDPPDSRGYEDRVDAEAMESVTGVPCTKLERLIKLGLKASVATLALLFLAAFIYWFVFYYLPANDAARASQITSLQEQVKSVMEAARADLKECRAENALALDKFTKSLDDARQADREQTRVINDLAINIRDLATELRAMNRENSNDRYRSGERSRLEFGAK